MFSRQSCLLVLRHAMVSYHYFLYLYCVVPIMDSTTSDYQGSCCSVVVLFFDH